MAPRILYQLALLLLSVLATAAEDFECRENTQIRGHEYDLTSLNAAHSASRERDTPPTTMVDSITFNLCSDLASNDLPERDQVLLRLYSRG